MGFFSKSKKRELPPLPPLDDNTGEFPEFPQLAPEEELPAANMQQTMFKPLPPAMPLPIKMRPMKADEAKEEYSGYDFQPQQAPEPIETREVPRQSERKIAPPPPPIMKIRKDKVIGNLPVYVRIEEFKDVLSGMNTIKENLKTSEEIFERLNMLKNSEDKEFERWRTQLEDIQRKLIYVDKVIFEAKGES